LANLGWIAIATGSPSSSSQRASPPLGPSVVALFRLGRARPDRHDATDAASPAGPAAANADLLDGPLRTLLPPPAVLLPAR
jgi:hypothetical protein